MGRGYQGKAQGGEASTGGVVILEVEKTSGVTRPTPASLGGSGKTTSSTAAGVLASSAATTTVTSSPETY